MSPPTQNVDLAELPEQGGKRLSYSHLEDGVQDPSGLTLEELAFVREFPEDRKKKILWKIDLRLIPFLTLLYLFSFIDRANIGGCLVKMSPYFPHTDANRQCED